MRSKGSVLKQKDVVETELWKITSWKDIVIAVRSWREFSLSSTKNSISLSGYELSLLKLLCKSVLCPGIP